MKKKLSKGFIKFACTLNKDNIDNINNLYYYWRLRDNSEDELVVTKIFLNDLKEIKI